MSIEEELAELARQRESVDDADRNYLLPEPAILLRQLRAYLARQADYGRIRRTNEKIPQLTAVPGGLDELACPSIRFSSGCRLDFNIRLVKRQQGWMLHQFKFHLRLPRKVHMVRIHLNTVPSREPHVVPRCHLHIGDSKAHIPFPLMNPRLILDLLCERIEPDLGI